MRSEQVLELRTSLFWSLLREEIDCDVCPHRDDDEACNTQVAILGKGEIFRHSDPPFPVAMWPACPMRWRRLWAVWDDPMGELEPRDYVEWEHERDAHKRKLTPNGEALFREWLRNRELPGRVIEAKAYEEAKKKRGNP